MINLTLLLLGFIFWYLYYGMECFINGAMGGWLMPFRCMLEDMTINPAKITIFYRLFIHLFLPCSLLLIKIYFYGF